MNRREGTVDGIEVWIYDNGAMQRRDNGQYLKPAPANVIRTTERAHEMRQLRREKGLRSRMKGIALGMGIDVDADAVDEDIIDAASDALEALTAHFVRTFSGSKNLRGMAESYGKLSDPFDKPEEVAKAQQDETNELSGAIRGLIDAIQEVASRGQQDYVEGDARDINILTDSHPKP
jgi:hypothetical protein